MGLNAPPTHTLLSIFAHSLFAQASANYSPFITYEDYTYNLVIQHPRKYGGQLVFTAGTAN